MLASGWFITGLALLVCGALGKAAEGSDMQLTGRHIAVRFSPETGGITGLEATDDGHGFLHRPADRPLLWRLTMRDAAGKEIAVDNAHSAPPAITARNGSVTLQWKGLDLPGTEGTLDIRVECRLNAAGDTALLRLWVDNRIQTHGLWSVQFPVISPLSEPGLADVAIGRGNWGELHAGAMEKLTGEYPSHNWPMQFVLLNEGADGLYLAAHDPQARPKNVELTPGGEFRLTTWAEGMGVPGSDWNAPYPFALGVYRGDWMAGCKRYRAWVHKQAPWMKLGPLVKRKDVPEAIRRVCAWIVGRGAREEAVPIVRRFARAVGAPVGVHWYDWHVIPFDTDYPAYFPAKPGFVEGVADLKREGVVVMPYINCRLWDSANREFPQARPHTAKDPQGSPLIEEYGSGAKLAVMCPSQSFWQERVREIVRRLGDECGVNAVYLDQIGSAPPRTCFDLSHGHALGSGSWWVDGYRKMLSPLREWRIAPERRVALTTENDAEPYMDNVEGFLVWTPRGQNEIPMTTAVYSGYALYFASNRALAGGDVAYALCQARDFTWGAQLGWEGPEIVAPEHAAKLEFLGRLARLRALAFDFMVNGELREVLRPVNDVPGLTGTWNTWQGDRPVTLPAVHAALWKDRNGSTAVALANADTEPHTVTLTLDADHHGLGRGDRWSLSRVTTAGVSRIEPPTGRRFDITVEVPARDGLLLKIMPARVR